METTENLGLNPKKLALTNALIWAIINIALFLVVYYVKPDLMASFGFAGISILVGLGLAVYFCIDMRKKLGGFWSFSTALSSIFIMFFTQAIIVLFFTTIFGKFIEPTYPEKMKEIATAISQQLIEKMGLDQDQIDKAMADSEVRIDKQFNPGIKEILISVVTIAIMYFISALIFAAIFKKEKPLFTNNLDQE
ncbi:MAG: DUF4199 domain-containing protein [Daejeonella sp.]